jgi:hypothetical protein
MEALLILSVLFRIRSLTVSAPNRTDDEIVSEIRYVFGIGT